jgi:acetyl esterase/lipase
MSPECHDDYVSAWCRNTRKPILSINYGKSPENPYPYALEEVYDAYRAVVLSNGKVLGMSGWTFPNGLMEKKPIKIVVA